MNSEFVKDAIKAFKEFVAAVGNDVATDSEYVVFNGQVAVDNKGNVKTYALVNNSSSGEQEPQKVFVAQVPMRPILDRAADFANSMVDLYEDGQKEANRKAEEEAKTENAEIEAENAEIENKISDLESQISNLKLRKKSVRHYHYVKRF